MSYAYERKFRDRQTNSKLQSWGDECEYKSHLLCSTAVYNFDEFICFSQRSQALKALDKNIIVAARDGKFESLIHMIDYLGVPVDFQESHVRFSLQES